MEIRREREKGEGIKMKYLLLMQKTNKIISIKIDWEVHGNTHKKSDAYI